VLSGDDLPSINVPPVKLNLQPRRPTQAKEKMQAVESLAVQKKMNVLQWQKSVKPVADDVDAGLITPSFSGSYEEVKGEQ